MYIWIFFRRIILFFLFFLFFDNFFLRYCFYFLFILDFILIDFGNRLFDYILIIYLTSIYVLFFWEIYFNIIWFFVKRIRRIIVRWRCFCCLLNWLVIIRRLLGLLDLFLKVYGRGNDYFCFNFYNFFFFEISFIYKLFFLKFFYLWFEVFRIYIHHWFSLNRLFLFFYNFLKLFSGYNGGLFHRFNNLLFDLCDLWFFSGGFVYNNF